MLSADNLCSSLDPDQVQLKVGPDLCLKWLTEQVLFPGKKLDKGVVAVYSHLAKHTP